jgi:hypothetical protein
MRAKLCTSHWTLRMGYHNILCLYDLAYYNLTELAVVSPHSCYPKTHSMTFR